MRSCFAIMLVLLACNTSNCEEAGQESQNKKKSVNNNIRMQLRDGFFGEDIGKERDIQMTYFAFLPEDLFFFFNIEFIYDKNTNKFYEFETNISRSFSPDQKGLKNIDWIVRLQKARDYDYDEVTSAGIQWRITETPALKDISRNLELKSYVQMFPIRSGPGDDLTDLYFYYSFPIFRPYLYLRGFERFFFVAHERDYYYSIQDFIVPCTKSLDVYGRYSYYSNDYRNNGFSLGIRYLITF